jgi:hypothetical protein
MTTFDESTLFHDRPAPFAVQWLGRRLQSIPNGPLRMQYLERKIFAAPVLPMVRILGCALRESATGTPEARVIIDMLGCYIDNHELPEKLQQDWIEGAELLEDTAVLSLLRGDNTVGDGQASIVKTAKDAPQGSLASEGETLGRRKSLARTATGDLIDKLIIDPDAGVIANLLSNPRLGEVRVVRLAGHRRTSPEILQTIGRSRFQVRADVRRALALNPKSPTMLAVRFLSALTRADLLQIAHDKRIEDLVRTAARDLIESKPPRLPLG